MEPSTAASSPASAAAPADVIRVGIGALAGFDATTSAAGPGRGTPGPGIDHALDLGPTHPTRAGMVSILITTSGREPAECASTTAAAANPEGRWNSAPAPVIATARVQPGYSHRAAEKLFEVRDYRQVLMLADRHDWSASVHGELVIAEATESLLGLPVPERAQELRAILAAHARVLSHLAFLQFVPLRTNRTDLVHRIALARGRGRDLLFALTGNRVHPMVVRLGGVAATPTPSWCRDMAGWADAVAELATDVIELVDADEVRDLAGGIGTLSASDVDAYGLSGVVAAGSGVSRHVHRPVRIPADATGDARSRFAALALDTAAAAAEVGTTAARLAGLDGPTETPLSKVVKVPEGDVFTDHDAPMGISGVHLVSRAGTTPWRLRLRTPTFANVQAMQVALVGTPLDRIDWVVASLGHTIGDLDK